MNREIGTRRALANAGLALAILTLAGFGMTQVARRQWRVQKTFPVCADFATIGGVEVAVVSDDAEAAIVPELNRPLESVTFAVLETPMISTLVELPLIFCGELETVPRLIKL